MRVADYVFKFLADSGVRDVFLVTGGGAMHLNDALKKETRIRHVCCHHEQACAIAAEGYYRACRRLPVVSVTTGPGGTNALTGVIGQWLDSIPCLYISGQVKFSTTVASCPEIKLRQLGDQEINIVDIVRPVTKYAVSVTDPSSIKVELEKAVVIAQSGRPGPVWLDIPLNVQGALIEPVNLTEGEYHPEMIPVSRNERQFASLLKMVDESRRPVLIAGHGIELDGAEEDLLKLVDKVRIPVLTTFNGMNVIPSEHELYFGRIGSVGQRKGNFVLQNADLVISIGSRNNIRQISYNWENFAKKALKVVVDIDEMELKKPTLIPDVAFNMSAKKFINMWHDLSDKKSFPDWMRWCEGIRRKYPPHTREQAERKDGVDPYHLAHELSIRCPTGATVVTGNGMACVAMFQTGVSAKGRKIFWNSGCAAMGFDLPAAIGAAIGTGDMTVCLAGDGSIMMNLQELETALYHKLPLKIFILENDGYMSIRQTQKNFFSADFIGCDETSGVGFPDFCKVAAAFGYRTREICSHFEMDSALDEVFSSRDPEVVVVRIPAEIEFTPKLSARRLPDGTMVSPSLEDMFPFLPREEMEANVCRI